MIKKNVVVLAVLALSAVTSGAFAQSRIGTDLIPLFGADISVGKKVINQTVGTNPNAVTLDPNGTDFKITQTSKVEVGAGFSTVWHFIRGSEASTLFGAGLGLMPVAGSTITVERSIGSGSTPPTPPTPPTNPSPSPNPSPVPSPSPSPNPPPTSSVTQIPQSAMDFSNWSDLDSVTFETSGGILFFDWIGYAGVGASGSYLAKGVWTTYVQKLNSNYVYVKITKAKIHALTHILGSIVASVDVTRFKDADQSFSYTFDISSPAGAAAYEDFVRGNVQPAQKMAASSSAGAVTLDYTGNGLSVGRISRLRVGIPMLLEAVKSSGKIYDISDSVSSEDGSKVSMQLGIYGREQSSRILFRERGEHSEVFYGLALKTTDKNSQGQPTTTLAQSGTLIWTYENTHSSSKSLSKAVADLIKDTGLGQDFAVTVPAANKLGYGNVQAVMTLPQATTNFLVSMAQFPNVLAALGSSATTLAKNYFAAGDADGICSNVNPQDVEQCQSDVEKETAVAAKTMEKQLTVMLAKQTASDWTGFVKAYAEFGKAMIKNQFTLRAVILATQSAPATIAYTIQGEKMDIFKREILNP